MNDTQDQAGQAQPRWPWFAAGALLLGSAALAAASVHHFWVPCQGSMLAGTVFAPDEAAEFTDSCLARMDTGFPFVSYPEDSDLAPSASAFGGLAMLLAAASWIVLILGLRLRRATKSIALIAGAAPTLVAVLNLAASFNPLPGPDPYTSDWLSFAVDAVAIVVILVLIVGRNELEGETLVGVGFVLWGATAFGGAHMLTEFFTMLGFNPNNWDVPPGTGWLTVAVLVVSGSSALWFGGRRQESPTQASCRDGVAV